MDTDAKWLAILFIGIAFCGAAPACVYQYQNAQIKIEAIKAGLHQEVVNGVAVWSHNTK